MFILRLIPKLFLPLLYFATPANGKEPPRRFPVHNIRVVGWEAEDPDGSVIPFTRAGNLILLRASADSIDGNFILDTGAPNLVLNHTYFREYPVTVQSDAQQTGITGTGDLVQRTSVTKFRIGTLAYNRVDADLLNLGHIENAKGVKVLGLLGVSLFRDCELVIDFGQGLIYLHRVTKKEPALFVRMQLPEKEDYRILPFELTDNRIITRVELNGKKMKFIVDCAAESNIIDSRLPDKVLDSVSITGRVLLTGSGNKKLEAVSGYMSGLRIADETLEQLPVLVTNLEKTCFSYGGCIDGILGFDFISRHKIGFNFVTRKIYIWK